MPGQLYRYSHSCSENDSSSTVHPYVCTLTNRSTPRKPHALLLLRPMSCSTGGTLQDPRAACSPCPANTLGSSEGATSAQQCGGCVAGFGGPNCQPCAANTYSEGGPAAAAGAGAAMSRAYHLISFGIIDSRQQSLTC